MGCYPSKPRRKAPMSSHRQRNPDAHHEKPENPIRSRDRPDNLHRFSPSDESLMQQRRHHDDMGAIEEQVYNAFMNEASSIDMILKGTPLDEIVNKCRQPPAMVDMSEVRDEACTIMIKPLAYNPSRAHHYPKLDDEENAYVDRWDDKHVQMPCSKMYMSRDKRPIWPDICQGLTNLKRKCEKSSVTFEDLKGIIRNYGECDNDMRQLQRLINDVYSNSERSNFMHHTLPKMCDLVLNLKSIFPRALPLLRIGSNQSVTISQEQAASLLACAFFCLFPYRTEKSRSRSLDRFPSPNFERLYETGSPEKTEKLKCILHYFGRVTRTMPTGVITIQRFQLPRRHFPRWNESNKRLCDLSLTTGTKIEDINNVLQVDFANKYIGGGVLGNGCVQEEIRFSICPEMLVSLLVCEMMEIDECVFLIGCERYSQYKGYAASFKFAGNFEDNIPRDNWGRKWCHLVAMDAIYFREIPTQYEVKNVERELLKAYTSFCPQGRGRDYTFGIATGNWGCGAFNGDRHMKAIIQLMAASEAERPLIYAAFGDKNLVNSFYDVYHYLLRQQATVGDLYWYLLHYSKRYTESSLFDYILRKPVSSLRS